MANPSASFSLDTSNHSYHHFVTPHAFKYDGPLPLRLRDLKKAFPEPGEYHFRMKCRHPIHPKVAHLHAWKDLVSDNEVISEDSRSTFEIKVLQINIDDGDEDEDDTNLSNNLADSSNAHASAADYSYQYGFTKSNVDHGLEIGTGSRLSESNEIASTFTRTSERNISVEFNREKYNDNQSGEDEDEDEDLDDNSYSSNDDDGYANENIKDIDEEQEERQYQIQQQRLREHFKQEARERESQTQSQRQRKDVVGLFGASSNSFGSFLKSAKKAAVNLAKEVSEQHGVKLGSLGKSFQPSSQQLKVLNKVASQLQTRFSRDKRDHLALLKTIWSKSFPSESFHEIGPQWQLLGFQKDDVEADPKVLSLGVVGIRCLTRFAQDFPKDVNRCLKARIPVAEIVLDVAYALASFLGLMSMSFCEQRRPFWNVFNDQASVFCQLTSITSHIALLERNVDSGLSIQDMVRRAMGQAKHVLDEGPKDMEEFRHIASALGIQV
eukprot:CAMPEP_0204823594 /NCGR_PEP_ID=MMETSP1346-20131115/1659_1 /ASSEMBLY_ACC=CAM_ASM_000771 /TAXON_ID=215587 /ORGANISM="Aplanochytrium stocchinoi, Strain GSBS06" /LENGTH=494 /DNA_ID=CAMNT_0051950291 /DNA_START=451 /DNA_END=1935 /DNA_ORIENTATION=+